MAKDSPSYEEAIFREMGSYLERHSPAEVAVAGRPPGFKAWSDDQQVEYWDYQPPSDWRQRAQAAQSDDDPHRQLEQMVGQRIDQLRQQGAEREAATLEMYPFREMLYSTGKPHIKDQIERAETIERKAAAKRADV